MRYLKMFINIYEYGVILVCRVKYYYYLYSVGFKGKKVSSQVAVIKTPKIFKIRQSDDNIKKNLDQHGRNRVGQLKI